MASVCNLSVSRYVVFPERAHAVWDQSGPLHVAMGSVALKMHEPLASFSR